MINLEKNAQIQKERKPQNFICGYCGQARPIAERVTTKNYSLCNSCQKEKGIRNERISLDLVKVVDREMLYSETQELSELKNQLYHLLYKIKYRNYLIPHQDCPPVDEELDNEIAHQIDVLVDYAQVSEYTLDIDVPEFVQAQNAHYMYLNGELYKIIGKNYIG